MASITTDPKSKSKRNVRIEQSGRPVTHGNGNPIRFLSAGHARRYAAEKKISLDN